jgi:hypothetical protein
VLDLSRPAPARTFDDVAASANNDCPKPSARRSSTYARTLHRACLNAGSLAELARRLGVPEASLERWIQGTEEPPLDVFLAAVDIALSPPPAANQ